MNVTRLLVLILCFMQLTVLIHITILDGAWGGIVLAITTILFGFGLIAYAIGKAPSK